MNSRKASSGAKSADGPKKSGIGVMGVLLGVTTVALGAFLAVRLKRARAGSPKCGKSDKQATN